MEKIADDSPEGVHLRNLLGRRITEGLSELPVQYQLAVAVSVVFRICEKLKMPKEYMLRIMSKAWDSFEKEGG